MVEVVSWKPLEILDRKKGLFKDIGTEELKSLNEKDVFTQLILDKLELTAESEEGKAAVETYLPLFMEISSLVEAENPQGEI